MELGGTYPDVVQALQEAKAAGALAARFEADALPEARRSYTRTASRGQDDPEGDDGELAADAESTAQNSGKKGRRLQRFLPGWLRSKDTQRGGSVSDSG